MWYNVVIMKKLAIFDIDGTIFRSSLLIELTEALIDQGIFDILVRKNYQKEHTLWLNRKGSYECYIEVVVRAFMDNLKGVYYSDFERVVKEVAVEQKNRVYCFTRDLIKDLRRKGYFLVAISQSPKTILDQFAKDLPFDKIYGRLYELGPSDRFTGKVIDEHLIINKANIVKRVLQKEEVTLKGSVAVGDTEGDISILEMVENPICFNPNATLYRHAKRNGWRVVVERKDVVYEIEGVSG
jgi:HAD superfamily hydrolase (TIGR01490 family)